ncbi:MAG TPA: hypothetical protein VG759_26465 [Candidatus Angelobacter sp.]|nr:hypothetical protein [Candidatus Angelobacter sp.]
MTASPTLPEVGLMPLITGIVNEVDLLSVPPIGELSEVLVLAAVKHSRNQVKAAIVGSQLVNSPEVSKDKSVSFILNRHSQAQQKIKHFFP